MINLVKLGMRVRDIMKVKYELLHKDKKTMARYGTIELWEV